MRLFSFFGCPNMRTALAGKLTFLFKMNCKKNDLLFVLESFPCKSLVEYPEAKEAVGLSTGWQGSKGELDREGLSIF